MIRKYVCILFLITFSQPLRAQKDKFKRALNYSIDKCHLKLNDTAIIRGIFFENGEGKYYGKIWIIHFNNLNLSLRYVNYSTDSRTKGYTIMLEKIKENVDSKSLLNTLLLNKWSHLENEFTNIDSLIGFRVISNNKSYFVRDYQNGKKMYMGLYLGGQLKFNFDTPFYELEKIVTNTEYIKRLNSLIDMIVFKNLE